MRANFEQALKKQFIQLYILPASIYLDFEGQFLSFYCVGGDGDKQSLLEYPSPYIDECLFSGEYPNILVIMGY